MKTKLSAKCKVCKNCYLTKDVEIVTVGDPEKTVEAMRRLSAHGFDTYQWNEDNTVTLTR